MWGTGGSNCSLVFTVKVRCVISPRGSGKPLSLISRIYALGTELNVQHRLSHLIWFYVLCSCSQGAEQEGGLEKQVCWYSPV